MSSTPVDSRVPRVREQARDALALMVFSALLSLAIAGAFLLLAGLSHRG